MAKAKKTPRKKTAAKKKKSQLSQATRIVLASIFLLGFVVFSLALLVVLQERFVDNPVLVYEEPAPEPLETHKIYSYTEIEHLVDARLVNHHNSQGWRKLKSTGSERRLQIFGPFPNTQELVELQDEIAATTSPAQLAVDAEKGQVILLWNDSPRLQLRYDIPHIVKTKPSHSRIAIIMDDMGGSLKTIKSLFDLEIPVTPAILPDTSRATAATSLLQSRGREYMIHMPMQPRSYPKTNPGKMALLIGQSEEQTRALVRSYIKAVPGAVGGNNHMGSRYTEDAAAMRIVLDELKKNGHFFIDSRTISNSVAFEEAKRMGVKTATRNIFLDNEDNVPYIRSQLRKMVRLAKNRSEVIAICHPHKETIEALRLEQNWLRSQPVEFVVASKLVHRY